MTLAVLPVADAEFANGQVAQGTEVNSQDKYLRDFINGSNFDPTNNIKTTVPYPWTSSHSWTVSDANTHNLSLIVSAVMAASKYGFKIATAAAQVNSALVYVEMSNSSSTVPSLEFSDTGSGSTIKITKSGNAAAIEAIQSGSGNSVAPVKSTQTGTGSCYEGSLRSLTSLNAGLTAKSMTTAYTADNTATELAIADLTTTLPANFLKAGTTIRGKLWGRMNTAGAGPATARIKVYYGGVAGTVLLDTGAFTPAVSLANSLVECEFLLTAITTGATGTIEAQGKVMWNSNTIPVARGMGTAGTGATNAAAITVDTTLAKDITVSFTWGSAVATCTFVARSGTIEIVK
jgi:hypothetical protein